MPKKGPLELPSLTGVKRRVLAEKGTLNFARPGVLAVIDAAVDFGVRKDSSKQSQS